MVLTLAAAGTAWLLLSGIMPDPMHATVISGLILLAGAGISLWVALRAAFRSDRYERCPACAFDVREVHPDPAGSIRCPACGQWLGA